MEPFLREKYASRRHNGKKKSFWLLIPSSADTSNALVFHQIKCKSSGVFSLEKTLTIYQNFTKSRTTSERVDMIPLRFKKGSFISSFATFIFSIKIFKLLQTNSYTFPFQHFRFFQSCVDGVSMPYKAYKIFPSSENPKSLLED